jgi:cyclopropane-fatty-acyl-phospholipid synthase
MSFRKQNLMNFQVQLTRRQGVVPMTRDYIPHEEAKLRGVEQRSRPRLKIAGE